MVTVFTWLQYLKWEFIGYSTKQEGNAVPH